MSLAKELFWPATLVPLAVYVWTLAPTITCRSGGADAGDLITAAYFWGIPHSPGYPVYTLLGKLFTLLPIGSVAYRLNFMNAILAAATIAVVYHWSQETSRRLKPEPGLAKDPPGGLSLPRPLPSAVTAGSAATGPAAAALLLAFSPTFWSQATITEVYILSGLLVALTYYLALRFVRQPSQKGNAIVLGVAAGLCAGHHVTSLLALPGVALFVIAGSWGRLSRPNAAWLVGTLAAAVLLPYGLLVLRAGSTPAANWGNPENWTNFFWLVSGRAYHGLAFAAPLLANTSDWLGRWPAEFGWPALILMVIGLGRLWQMAPLLAAGSLLSLLLVTLFTAGYQATDIEGYLIPAFVIAAFWAGLGLVTVIERVQQFRPSLLPAVMPLAFILLLLPPVLTSVRRHQAEQLSADALAADNLYQMLLELPAGAILATDQDCLAFTGWYYHHVEKVRLDIAIVYIPMLQWEWYRSNMSRLHPWLPLSDIDPQQEWPIATLLRHDNNQHPFYLTYQVPLPPGYELRPQGTLFQVQVGQGANQ